MLKIIGFGLIFITTVSLGVHFSDRLKEKVKILNSLEFMFDDILIMVRYKAMTVYDIITELRKKEISDTLSFLKKIEFSSEISFSGNWSSSIDETDMPLSVEELNLLKSFGSSLGSSDIEGQISTIELYKHNFIALYKKACNDYEKKSKLYKSLGVISGAFIIIMLI